MKDAVETNLCNMHPMDVWNFSLLSDNDNQLGSIGGKIWNNLLVLVMEILDLSQQLTFYREIPELFHQINHLTIERQSYSSCKNIVFTVLM